MMKLCDLHTHSCFSDGSCTPEELIRLAEDRGLAALALTDHNTVKGLDAFMSAGARSRVIPVPGCEFTAQFEGRETHIVALFLPREAWPAVETHVEALHRAKQYSNELLLRALQKDGYAVTFEEVAALTDAAAFNRAHVARVLLAKGYVQSIPEAFGTLLREGGGYYTPAEKLDALETVRFIKACGATAVMAHPFLTFDTPALERFLPKAADAGLDAIETMYSRFDAQTTREAIALAEKYGLRQSGGSDFHGASKPDVALGTGCGDLAVPFAFYTSLKP